MRCGSVITNLPLVPSPRLYATHTANCRFLNGGVCGECIKRCPAGAITEKGHDKLRCKAYLDRILARLGEEYQVTIAGCGLCQTTVPCEAGIPSPT